MVLKIPSQGVAEGSEYIFVLIFKSTKPRMIGTDSFNAINPTGLLLMISYQCNNLPFGILHALFFIEVVNFHNA